MGKASRLKRQNSNFVSSSAPSNGNGNGNCKYEERAFQSSKDEHKDDQYVISKMRELNQKLIKDIHISQHKVADMESQIHILQVASTNFESKMDNRFGQQVKIGEQLSDHLMEIDKEFRQQLAKRDHECETEISKVWQQLQEAEERFKREISEKEKDCRSVVSDKQILETTVLQLTDKMKVISAEFEAARKAWESEKDGLLSQIVAAQKETGKMVKDTLIAEQAWNADKESLLSQVERKHQEKIADMATQNERVLLEKLELESQLNDYKARTQKLLENFEDDRNLWNYGKQNLQGNAAELQIKIDSMVSERGLLCQKNIELSTEAESLKTQLNENKARLAQVEDGKLQNERFLQQCRTENSDLQSRLNDSKRRTRDLLRKYEEDKHLWDAEKSNLQGTVAELKTKHELMATEMGSLTQKNTELSVEAEFLMNQVSALESELNASKQRTQELLQKSEEDRHLWDEKCETEISKAWQELQEAEERFKREVCEKEEDCRAVVLQLTDKIKVISAEFEAARKAWESQIVAGQKETEEIVKDNLIAGQAWNADNEALLSQVERTHVKKMADMAMQKERVLVEMIELESQLNDSKAMTQELLAKFEDNGNLWNVAKQNLEGNATELQVKIDLMVSEAEFLQTQLNENQARLAEIEDECAQNKRVLQHIDLQSDLNDSKRTQDLLRKNEEDMHLWDAENSNLEGTVAELKKKQELMACDIESLTQRNKELSLEAEYVMYQVNTLECELNDFKKRTGELFQKSEKKRDVEGTIAALTTEHEDLTLQLFEEELPSAMSSASKDEVKIGKLRSQLLAVTEEKDEQRQIFATAEEKKEQLESLQEQLSSIAAGKQIFEEGNEPLLTELKRRALFAEEEKGRLEGIVREKERQFVHLQNQHAELVEAKKCLANKYHSLHSELNRCTLVSDENIHLHHKIRKLETALDSLKRESMSGYKSGRNSDLYDMLSII